MTTETHALSPLCRRHVNLDALAGNIRALKALTRPGTAFMAVVKADAYGHGAVEAARTTLDAGADHLAVARISEAVVLRDAGIEAPILLFGEVRPDQVGWMAANEIRASIGTLETADRMAKEARALGVTLKIHIKVDTGMGRLGLVIGGPEGDIPGAAGTIDRINGMAGLEIEGMYTHLARADETDLVHARDQVGRFADLIQLLEDKGCRPRLCHAANSAGLIALPQSHFDMVRPGIAMYGLWPSGEVDRTGVELSPVMSIRTQVIHIKDVPEKFAVSYGGTHVTKASTTIATVPVGYADGYSRLLSNKGVMLVKGQKAPITGRVCMDFTMIDVGHIPGVAIGDEVVLMGSQGETSFTADDIAGLTGTINYEVTAGLTSRMPLIFSREGNQP